MNAKVPTPKKKRDRKPAPSSSPPPSISVSVVPGKGPQITMPEAETTAFVEAHWQSPEADTIVEGLVELEKLLTALRRAEKSMQDAAMKPQGPERDAEIWRYGTLVMVIAKRIDALEARACAAWPPVSHVEAFGGPAGA